MTKQKPQIITVPFPLQISELPKGVIAYPDGRITAEDESRGSIVIRAEGKPETEEVNLNIKAGRNSELKIVIFQNISAESSLTININCESETSARVHIIQFHIGGTEVKMNLTQKTSGEGAQLDSDLFSITKGEQKHDFDMTNVYDGKSGSGKILSKGVALGNSRLNMTGTIRITKKGGGTDSFLKQESFFLSKQAKISSSPRLEIGTNDVKAGHGASITNLNDENMFYLTSRGISIDEARNMMIKGFVSEQLDKIEELPELQEEIMQII